MASTTQVNIDFIIERIHRRYGFEDIDKSDVAESLWDAVGIIHVPETYEEVTVDINIVDWQGTLPLDFFEVEGVMDKVDQIPLTHNPDTLNLFDTSYSEDPDTDPYTYLIKGDYIFCGLEDTVLQLVYKRFPTDDNSMPVIPNDPKAIRAMRDWVAEQIAFKLMLKDRITESKYDRIAKESYFSTASYRSAAVIPNTDQLERIKNRYITLLRRPDMHDNLFKWLGSKTKLSAPNTTTYYNSFITSFTLTATSDGQTTFDRPSTVSQENLSTIASEGSWVATISDQEYSLTYSTDISYDSSTDVITYIPNEGALSVDDTIEFEHNV